VEGIELVSGEGTIVWGFIGRLLRNFGLLV
jgi:hypothetical protein